MNTINDIDINKLITFLLYIFIVIILTSILYNMYNDFLSEKYFNIKKFNLKEKFTDSDIEQKLNYINLINKISKKQKPQKIQKIQKQEQVKLVENFSSTPETILEVIPETLEIKNNINHFYPFSENVNIDDETYVKNSIL